MRWGVFVGILFFVATAGLLLLLTRRWMVAREAEAQVRKATLITVLQTSPDRWNHARRAFPAPDLSGIQLRNANFSGLDFSSVDFSNAQMRGVVFQDCDFSRSDLRWAVVTDVRFERAKLDSMVAQETDFRHTVFLDSQVQHAHFWAASLEDVLFEGGSLRYTGFSSVKIKHMSIVRSDFSGGSIGQPRLLDGLEIRDTKMDGFLYRAFAKEERISIVNSSPCPYPLRAYCR